MKRALLASLSMLPALFAAPAHADTLEDALIAAHRSNPNLEDARLAVRSAREDSAQARAAYLPVIDLTATTGTTHSESDIGAIHQESDLDPAGSGVRLQQQIFTGGRRIGQSQLAHAGVESARQGLRSTEQNVLLTAVQAYLNVRRDDEIVRLREAYVAGLEQQVTGTQRRLQVGEVSRTDVAQAQTRLSGAQASLARARADAQQSEARYAQIIGVAPHELAPVTAPATPDSLEGAVRQAENSHPDLQQSRSSERAARARVTIERAALLPQVSVAARIDQADDTDYEDQHDESTSTVAQLSVPLFEGGYAWSRTHQSRINVQRARARVEAQRREVVANVITAWNDLIAEREVIVAARTQEEASRTALAGVERERGLGMRSTLDVLNAEAEVLSAQIDLAGAEASSTLAAYALLSATGALSLENLGLHD